VGIGLNGFIFKKYYINEKKRSWELFRICLLSSTANPAQFGWKLGSAVLLSRQILISSQDHFFSYLDIIFFIFKYETIETYARAFFMVLSIGGVMYFCQKSASKFSDDILQNCSQLQLNAVFDRRKSSQSVLQLVSLGFSVGLEL
jgi:hypothetical protein